MEDKNLALVDALDESLAQWTVDSLSLPLSTDYTADHLSVASKMVDYCSLTKGAPKTHPAGTRFYLPPIFSRNDKDFRQKHILPFFSNPCAKHGMELYIRGWDEKRSVIQLTCTRHRPYRPKQDAQEARNTNTKRPHVGVHVACPFSIRVGYDDKINRWFVPAYTSGNMQHVGHHSITHIAQASVTATVPFSLTQELHLSDLRHAAATEAPRERSVQTVLDLDETFRQIMDMVSAYPYLGQGVMERMDKLNAWLISQTPTAAPVARQAREGHLISSLHPTDRRKARESRKRSLNEGLATELSRDDLM